MVAPEAFTAARNSPTEPTCTPLTARITSPQEFEAFLASETKKWGDVAKAARVQLDLSAMRQERRSPVSWQRAAWSNA